MSEKKNRRLLLKTRPSGMVEEKNIEVSLADVPEPADGQALVKVSYLSMDPTIRTWMDDAVGYMPPIGLGEVVRGAGIGEVVSSRSEKLKEGQLVFGMLGWQDYVLAGDGAEQVQALPNGIDPLAAINVFGITGMTGYFGMLEVGALSAGDVVVVSAAAGATGSTACQVAKASGAGKVIGIAGGPEKCAFLLDELGLDAAIDYKNDDVRARLRAEAPGGIDLYFDNVGGPLLDHALSNLAMRGRVVLCGAIAGYNDRDEMTGPKYYTSLIIRRGRMEGFIVSDFLERWPEAQGKLLTWLLGGKLKHFEHVVEGLENTPSALNVLFEGGNVGKVVVRL